MKKLFIISACGGHLSEVQILRPLYQYYNHFYVLNKKILLSENMKNKTFFITHSERDLKFFKNLFEAFLILWKGRPAVLLSMGAGSIVPFALVGRLFGVKTIYIETITSIYMPTLTGRIMYRLAHHFYYQWPTLSKYFPKGICIEPFL